MSEVIIDTNVAVVANHQNPEIIDRCVDACIHFLTKARETHVVLIDCGDEIRTEYAKALRVSRPYQLGALFMLHIYQQQYNPKRVRRVDLPKGADGDFVDFPKGPDLAGFDHDDRKFAALAKKTGIAVTTASDSDWADHLAVLNANNIGVSFLCGSDKTKWFRE